MTPRPRLTLWQAVSLNMAMMVGIGPFVTIPDLMKAVGGPGVLALWVLGAMVAMADGLVWSELAAAFPGSGGTYHFYDAAFGNAWPGRLLKFLFVWQFLFSAPLELASGALGFARYLGYFQPGLVRPLRSITVRPGWTWGLEGSQLLAMAAIAGLVGLAYRKIEAAGRWMVVLCGGMIFTVGWIIVAGLWRFDASVMIAAPSPQNQNPQTLVGIGEGMSLVMYCYLGYYQICYLGDEVENPSKTIPRSILLSVPIVAAAYFLLHLSIMGVVPREAAQRSLFIASDFMTRLHGPWAANAITVLIVWTGAAGTYAAILSYSRVPYAAAKAGHFFRGLAKLHPTGGFPARSLVLVGALAILACLAELKIVIAALLASRILIQFVGQIITVFALASRPGSRRNLPFRMMLYPVPALVALVGWLYVFAGSGWGIMAYGLGSMAAGFLAFLARDWAIGRGPPEPKGRSA